MLTGLVRSSCAAKVPAALSALAAPGTPPLLVQQLASAVTEQAVANLDPADPQVKHKERQCLYTKTVETQCKDTVFSHDPIAMV